MTSAEESVRTGNLKGALEDLQSQIRKAPADARLRVFLFQLLAVMGQWDRALTQLKVAGELDAANIAMVQTYQEVLRCEAQRRAVFAGERTPLVFGKPVEWMALLIQALRLIAEGRFPEAQRLREQAFERAPAVPGRVDDQPFTWIADADPRLGPVLEAVVNGRYFWIPFALLREIKLEKPIDLRDLVWTPAQLVLANGGETVALIPSRYPGSESADDPGVVMARGTVWTEHPSETFLGSGQRVLATDEGEYSLLDVRLIQLESPVGDGAAEPVPGS